MYKVNITAVEGIGADFVGKGSTVKTALNRARKAMEEYYQRGVAGFLYDTYKQNIYAEEGWNYLQTFGA